MAKYTVTIRSSQLFYGIPTDTDKLKLLDPCLQNYCSRYLITLKFKSPGTVLQKVFINSLFKREQDIIKVREQQVDE